MYEERAEAFFPVFDCSLPLAADRAEEAADLYGYMGCRGRLALASRSGAGRSDSEAACRLRAGSK
jgi:hypothetical protein